MSDYYGTYSNMRTLYHTTSPENAEFILAYQEFRLGKSSSSFGPGIYFAVTPKDSKRKATHQGATLEATVDVGKALKDPCQRSFTWTELKAMGYDSVLNTKFRGDEYVVYNPSQVTNIRKYSNTVKFSQNTLEYWENLDFFDPSTY